MVGAQELNKLVFVNLAVFSANLNVIGAYIGNLARPLCEHDNARVNRRLIFHTGSYNRVFGAQERYCLLLHVRAHQRTVGIVVLKEGNHSRSNRNHHLRRNVHIVGS